MTKLISYKGKRFVALCGCGFLDENYSSAWEKDNQIFGTERVLAYKGNHALFGNCNICAYDYWIILPKGEKV